MEVNSDQEIMIFIRAFIRFNIYAMNALRGPNKAICYLECEHMLLNRNSLGTYLFENRFFLLAADWWTGFWFRLKTQRFVEKTLRQNNIDFLVLILKGIKFQFFFKTGNKERQKE